MTGVKKCPMFSPYERNILFGILKKYSKVIENKQTNATTIYEKRETWVKVSKEFNAIAGVVPRDLAQLKRFWDKQKAICRKDLAIQKRHAMATGGGPPRNSVVGEEIIAQVMSIIPGLDEEVDCRDSDFFHQQRANLSRVSTATATATATATPVPITHPVSFPAPVTTTTLVSFATSPPVSPPIHIQTFPLSHPPVSLPTLESVPVPSGSSSQQLQWFPTAEESPASVSLGPSSPAETLIQHQECLSTPISVGSVQRRRASNSARLGEELRVRLDKARGGLEAQTEHEQLKLDHTKKILQLKLEKESEILELRLHNERERNRVAARYQEELYNIAVKTLNAARSHQDAVNQILLEKAQLEREKAQLERESALRLSEQHSPRH